MQAPAPAVRTVAVRFGQVAITFVLFSIFNAIAVKFEIAAGVSILFPATAISILGCMYFGIWAGIGVFLATLATPSPPDLGLVRLLIAAVINAGEGLLPWLIFSFRRDLSRDLRDVRSLMTFLLFGTVVNTGFSAIAGNLLVVSHAPGVAIEWYQVFIWWTADFVAALLLATPVLAFAPVSGERDRARRSMVNMVQITSIIVLLGFAASFGIRTWLLRSSMGTTDARKIVLVSEMVDGLAFVVLVLAVGSLLLNISRPFRQLHDAIERMRHGERFDASRIDSRFDEFRSLAATIERNSNDLVEQTERAVAASRHKSDFLAKMSHELRTPLNSIIGFSDLLMEQEDTVDSHRRQAFLTNVARSARHLLNLINDLLDIAKVEAGKMPLELEDVDLRNTIAATVASTAPLFQRKRQEVLVEVADRPMIVRADRGRMEQVLLNLLSNANKFTAEGEKITVRAAELNSEWSIEVADRGIGISPQDQKRIFDDFEQIHSSGTLSHGTGLGLALARRFVEAHGGAIDVESEIGSGAMFRVRLPRSQGAADQPAARAATAGRSFSG